MCIPLADRLNRSPPVCECSFITTPVSFTWGHGTLADGIAPSATGEGEEAVSAAATTPDTKRAINRLRIDLAMVLLLFRGLGNCEFIWHVMSPNLSSWVVHRRYHRAD